MICSFLHFNEGLREVAGRCQEGIDGRTVSEKVSQGFKISDRS